MPAPPTSRALLVLAALLGGGLAWVLFNRPAAPAGADAAPEVVIAALEARVDRTAAEELQLGKALNAVGREQAALNAFLRAAEAGVVDEQAKVFAFAAIAQTPDARANTLLSRWPNASVEPLLVEALARPWPLRANALAVLARRGVATDGHRRQVALLDLETSEPCPLRQQGFDVLQALDTAPDHQRLAAISSNDPCLGGRVGPPGAQVRP